MGLTDRDSEIAVVGLGSPIMCDDAVGLRVSLAIDDMHLDNVECHQEAVGGLDILPVIHGYRFAIIVDAIQTGEYEPGTIMIYSESDFDSKINEAASHDVNLPTAIKIGRQMDPGLMPEKIMFIAIEVEDIKTVTETMTPRLEAAVPRACEAVKFLIGEFRKQDSPDRSS
jgi:hydrogenase maturation protease